MEGEQNYQFLFPVTLDVTALYFFYIFVTPYN